MDSWVPADACRLPSAQQPLRVAEFDDLFARSLQQVERRSSTRLTLTLGRYLGITDTVEDLVSRETACCSFFTFAVHAQGSVIMLDVSVPETRADVLDGLEVRATTLMAGRRQ